MSKTGADVFHVPIIEDEALFVPSKGWAEMIRKVFEVDPLKIIDHLKLTFMAERPPPSQVVQQELMMAAEERGEYL